MLYKRADWFAFLDFQVIIKRSIEEIVFVLLVALLINLTVCLRE